MHVGQRNLSHDSAKSKVVHEIGSYLRYGRNCRKGAFGLLQKKDPGYGIHTREEEACSYDRSERRCCKQPRINPPDPWQVDSRGFLSNRMNRA